MLSNIEGLRADERRIAAQPIPQELQPLYTLYDRAVSALLDALVTAGALRGINDENRFVEAYLLLGTKILHNAEAVYVLVRNGWPSSGFPLYRSILSDGWMLWYLYLRPELRERWVTEEAETYYTDRAFRQAFTEAEMTKTLRDAGVNITDGVFSFFSKPSHGSAYGARTYLTQGRFVMCPLDQPDKTIPLFLLVSQTCLSAVQVLLRAFADHSLDSSVGRRLAVEFPSLEAEWFGLWNAIQER